MANPSKAKGDRAELQAVAYLIETAPHLVSVAKPQRKLGAGRAEDTGDLWVFDDVAIQVRSYDLSAIGTALRSAARDSAIQAANGHYRFALGMVPIPRAKAGTVRWLAAVTDWPLPPVREPIHFELVGRMLTWLRDDEGPYGFDARPRTARIATLRCTGGRVVWVAPMDAWFDCLQSMRAAAGRSLAS